MSARTASDPILLVDRECTTACRSQQHAAKLLSAMTASREPAHYLKCYCRWLCSNFYSATDAFGRKALHFAASSGNWEIVNWLVENCPALTDLPDAESGWTPLHRSFYYKQMNSALALLRAGASLKPLDFNGFSPLDLLLCDRLPFIEFKKQDPCEVYVWGQNDNFNLGLENETSRKLPEVVATFARERIFIKQVEIRKFHSIFLTHQGRVFTCGYGHGGRLGQGNEDISMKPKQVEGLGKLVCEQMAAGQDHALLLIEGGQQVYTFGLNTYHQLGHIPAPEQLDVAKPISLKGLKGGQIVTVGAAKYHSLFVTLEGKLFTFGLNGGQLGHLKGNRTQLSPKQVTETALNIEDNPLVHVVTSTGAIVCSNKNGDVYVLHEYQCRRIASTVNGLLQICVTGGRLNELCDVSDIISGGGNDLRVIMLTKTGFIYLWMESDPFLTRCILQYDHEIFTCDMSLNFSGALVVSDRGEAFKGSIMFRKPKKQDTTEKAPHSGAKALNESGHKLSRISSINVRSVKGSQASPLSVKSAKAKQVASFATFLTREECHLIKLKRIPLVHRAVAIKSDSKNINFAVLQSFPKLGMTETPEGHKSLMEANFKSLFETSDARDSTHDVLVKVGQNQQYAAHRYILAHRSDYFCKLFAADPGCQVVEINTTVASPEAFDQVIKFIYTNTNDLFENGKRLNWPKLNEINLVVAKGKQGVPKKGSSKAQTVNPVEEVKEASKRLGVKSLHQRLLHGSVTIVDGNRVKVHDYSGRAKLTFQRSKFCNMCDITLISKDGQSFKCHRCVLVARLEYFRNMLEMDWLESFSTVPLEMPIPSQILRILVDFLYTDGSAHLQASGDPEFICHVLVVADQFLVPELKMQCEAALVELLTTKNACELLELSYIYNAAQLRKSCLNYIAVNISYLIEANALDILGDEAIEDFTKYYQNLMPSLGLPVFRQQLKEYFDAPSTLQLEQISKLFGDDKHDSFEAFNKKDLKTPTPNKKVMPKKINSKSRTESSSSDILVPEVKSEVKDVEKAVLAINESLVEVKNEVKNEAQNKEKPPQGAKIGQTWSPLLEQQPVQQKPKGGWGITSLPPPTRMQDIMKEESSQSKPLSGPHFRFPKSKPVKSPAGAGAGESHGKEVLESFASAAKSPPKSSSSPWKVIESVTSISLAENQMLDQHHPSSSLKMSEIIKGEKEQIDNMIKYKAKPLAVISKEDRAIEELLVHYNSKDNAYERISVKRVLPENVATPVWTRPAK